MQTFAVFGVILTKFVAHKCHLLLYSPNLHLNKCLCLFSKLGRLALVKLALAKLALAKLELAKFELNVHSSNLNLLNVHTSNLHSLNLHASCHPLLKTQTE